MLGELPEHDESEDAMDQSFDSDSSSEQGPNLLELDKEATWEPVLSPEMELPDSERPFHFSVRESGPKGIGDQVRCPIQFFFLFFTSAVLTNMVRETNRYAKAFLNTPVMKLWLRHHPKSRFHNWCDTTMAELKKFFGLLLAMGLLRKKRLADYWSSNPILSTPFFGSVMCRDRFLLLNRMLHINDKSKEIQRGEKGFDPWVKVRKLLDTLNKLFKKYYAPTQNISIDESLVAMKNRIVYIQYLRNKRHARFGIKKFELCDSNGYTMHVALYAGKDFDLRCRNGQAHIVVMELLRAAKLLHKGYHVFTDRFYTKPELAEELYQNRTFITGTCIKNCKGFPKELANQLPVGGAKFMRKNSLLGIAFREKKSQKQPVTLISTKHRAAMKTKVVRTKTVTKPEAILNYNSYMGGVDLRDKKLYHYASERATHRYWTKIMRNLMDIAVLNAYELYKLKNFKQSKKDFILSIITDLCKASDEPQAVLPLTSPNPNIHKLILLEGKKEMNCYVCSTPKKRSKSRTWCPRCKVGVHMKCEAMFHHSDLPLARRGQKRPIDISLTFN